MRHKNHLLHHNCWETGHYSARCWPKRRHPCSKTGDRSVTEMTKHHINIHLHLPWRTAPLAQCPCLMLIFQSLVIHKESKQKIVLEAQRPRLQNKSAANPKAWPVRKGREVWKLPLFLPLFCQDWKSGLPMCEKDHFSAILSTKYLPHISLQHSPPIFHTQGSWGFCFSTSAQSTRTSTSESAKIQITNYIPLIWYICQALFSWELPHVCRSPVPHCCSSSLHDFLSHCQN